MMSIELCPTKTGQVTWSADAATQVQGTPAAPITTLLFYLKVPWLSSILTPLVLVFLKIKFYYAVYLDQIIKKYFN